MIDSGFSLSSADVTGLPASLQTLLSPFEYAGVDEWRTAVNRSLQALMGADMVTFALPITESTEYFSEQIDYSALTPSYPEWLAICEPQFRTIERAVALGAFSRKMLYRPWWGAFRRSAYYNDFVVPLRAYDSIGIDVRAGRENRVCCLLFHHERPTGKRFGRRGIALARLILPAFRAAVGAYLHRRDHRLGFTAALDGLAEGVLLADASGRTLHRNPALGQMLASDPERAALTMAIGQVAGSLARLAKVTGSHALPAPVVRTVRTTLAQYQVRATYLVSALDGAGTIALVTVERRGDELPALKTLRERWRLTQRECQVAQFLMRGKSDAVIAHSLGTSIHTARHHAESVRLKLDVHSRQDVEQVIRQLYDGPACASSPDLTRH